MTDDLDKPIGTKEASKLTASDVIVKEVTIEPAKEGGKAKVVKLHCKHPDKDELIALSSASVQRVNGSNKTIKKETLWYNTDDDGNIRKSGVVAEVMRFYKVDTLRKFEDLIVHTEQDTAGYLTIKAY